MAKFQCQPNDERKSESRFCSGGQTDWGQLPAAAMLPAYFGRREVSVDVGNSVAVSFRLQPLSYSVAAVWLIVAAVWL